MYQLLLVDDECSIVEALTLTIPWKKYGVTKVFGAYSAYEALDIIEENTIDIVISDIKMPGVSGIELIQEIRAKWERMKCILLSGHDDFHYAQQAIQSGISDYLLKPVKDEELIDALQRAINKLDEEWMSITSYGQAMSTIKRNLSLLRRNFLTEIFKGASFSRELFSEKLDLYEIPIREGDSIILLNIRLDEIHHACQLDSYALIQFSVENTAEHVISEHFQFWSCIDEHENIVFVIKLIEVNTKINVKKLLSQMGISIQNYVKKYIHCKVSIFLGEKGIFPNDLSNLYEQSITELRRHSGKETEFFLTTREGETSHMKVNGLKVLYQLPSLHQLLETGRFEEARVKIASIFEELKDEHFTAPKYSIEVYYTIKSSFIYVAHKNSLELSFNDDYIKRLYGRENMNPKQLKSWAFDCIEKIEDFFVKEQSGYRNSVIHQVQKYIEDNLEKDVSLQAIAEHVYLHPVYLSKIYKAETGKGLSDFIFELRMKKASKHLLMSNQKINCIAKSIGYQNTSYFIKVFKECFGKTPQEFRNEKYEGIYQE